MILMLMHISYFQNYKFNGLKICLFDYNAFNISDFVSKYI